MSRQLSLKSLFNALCVNLCVNKTFPLYTQSEKSQFQSQESLQNVVDCWFYIRYFYTPLHLERRKLGC